MTQNSEENIYLYLDYAYGSEEPIVSFNDARQKEKCNSLPIGYYYYTIVNDEPYLAKFNLPTTNSSINFAKRLIDFNSLNFLFSETSKALHNDLGSIRKEGYLLYGPQGTGKSTIMESMAQVLMENYEVRVFYLHSDIRELIQCLHDIKKLRKKKHFKACILMDEAEEILTQEIGITKEILDGQRSINDVIFIGATNHINQIPNEITNRPSRFKHVINIDGIKEIDLVFNVFKELNDNLRDTLKLSDEELRQICDIAFNDISKENEDNVITIDQLKHFFQDYIINYNKEKQQMIDTELKNQNGIS